MSLILKMQINDQSENKYIFSTENGEIELIPLSVIENGTYTPEQGQAFSTVTVAVPQTVLEQLNITENGTYEASSGHAYDVVTVNVQPILDILVDTVNENGTYVYEPDEGYDGLEEVRVTVSVPEPVFEHLTKTITTNGTYNYTPTTGKDGFDEAHITVNVPQPQPNLEQKSAYYDTNGNYTIQPSQGYDGIESVAVQVDVQGGGPSPVVESLELTGANKITQNGNYTFLPATYLADYFDSVDLTVDVSGGGGLSNVLKLTYTPSANTNAEETVATGYTGSGYIIGILAVKQGSTEVTKYGCLHACSIMKRYPANTPTYDGNNTSNVNTASITKTFGYGSNLNTGGSNNLQLYNSASGSTGTGTGATSISIASATSIVLRHIPGNNSSASTTGFMYGETYDVYVIYSA